MTDIVVDIRNVASQVHPDDRIFVWAPHLRERTGGGLTSTAPEEIALVDGQTTIEGVDPGPLMVRFECMGISDTSDKQGTVPDSGPVSIFDVLKNDLTWTPAVVNHGLDQLESARDEALDQVSDAVSAEVESIRWTRPPLTSSSNIDNLPDGTHPVGVSAATALNLPVPWGGELDQRTVVAGTVGGSRTQMLTQTSQGVTLVNRRTYWNGTWSSWQLLIQAGSSPLLGDRNLNDVREPALYLQTFSELATVDRNYPPISGADKSGALLTGSGGAGVTVHVYIVGRAGEIWIRSRTTAGIWVEWKLIGGTTVDLTPVYTAITDGDATTLDAAKAYADALPAGATPEQLTTTLTTAQNYAAAGDRDLSVRIDGHDTRISSVEVLGGLAPGDVSDATVSSLLSQSNSSAQAQARRIVRDEIVDPFTEAGSYLDTTYLRTERAHAAFVTSPTVRRLITDPDARVTLREGDILLAPPTAEKRTSFYSTPVGVSPARWSPRWGVNQMRVAADSECLGGKLLQIAATGTALKTVSWDALGREVQNVEVLMRWRTDHNNTVPRFIFRGDGDLGNHDGHAIYVSASGAINWQTYTAGVQAGGVGANVGAISLGTWYRTRVRMYDTTVYIKMWRDDQPEPPTWQAAVVRSVQLPPGWVGIGAYATGTLDIDWVTAALDGGIAPEMEA